MVANTRKSTPRGRAKKSAEPMAQKGAQAVRGDQARTQKPRSTKGISKSEFEARRAILKEQICDKIASTGRRKTPVAEELGVTRRQLWEWQQSDADFVRALEAARIAGTEALVEEAGIDQAQ